GIDEYYIDQDRFASYFRSNVTRYSTEEMWQAPFIGLVMGGGPLMLSLGIRELGGYAPWIAERVFYQADLSLKFGFMGLMGMSAYKNLSSFSFLSGAESMKYFSDAVLDVGFMAIGLYGLGDSVSHGFYRAGSSPIPQMQKIFSTEQLISEVQLGSQGLLKSLFDVARDDALATSLTVVAQDHWGHLFKAGELGEKPSSHIGELFQLSREIQNSHSFHHVERICFEAWVWELLYRRLNQFEALPEKIQSPFKLRTYVLDEAYARFRRNRGSHEFRSLDINRASLRIANLSEQINGAGAQGSATQRLSFVTDGVVRQNISSWKRAVSGEMPYLFMYEKGLYQLRFMDEIRVD
ncbi:MAG: hypothetical protein HYS98_04435, partial [Deltaproteobacteria bacterium]|nr:hypothetical protein [Deltaproteobacteria bacterium]